MMIVLGIVLEIVLGIVFILQGTEDLLSSASFSSLPWMMKIKVINSGRLRRIKTIFNALEDKNCLKCLGG